MQALVPGNYDFTIQAGANFSRSFRMQDANGNAIAFTGYTPRLVAKINLDDANDDAVFNFSGAPYLVFDTDWNLAVNLPANVTDLVPTPCCLYYALSLVSDANPTTDILAYLNGVINVEKRADTV